ncbi:peptide chain release factor N(5)-glutamine methyltransferase [Calidifontibacter sp. DB0510]|uniref:Release factor glutamine methyltransferase n=1 Tax=Metallococcus carri TaxID=1656884 RepID=A0A967EAL2_9MICO|nr:peptide chain release factor N(5)-glutamine methyltransferase [Metallococcus carri]NHN56385.1 peptide chain release factor N(5)-glutamine methyltransferase [Metallococcus carri]NOP36009.1 peptide chain release factor N(5)-glutamine methyltransferase [Calidifontibacter sp. DB2511S]
MTRSLLREAADRLAAQGVSSPDVDALALLEHVWDVPDVRAALVLGRAPSPQVAERFEELVALRAERVPLQHLTGVAHFRGLTLKVGPGVFVPRPETESIVDLVLAVLPDGGRVVDLGTGSGAIALALAVERPDAFVGAVEVSEHAHAWALLNRDALAPTVDLRLGDARAAFPELDGEIDVVVSNPPYIPAGMVPVDPEVRDHDPDVALYGGSADGLRIPLEVAARASALLRPGGTLVMEHAETQGDSLPAALARAGWTEPYDVPDLTGRPRFAIARR